MRSINKPQIVLSTLYKIGRRLPLSNSLINDGKNAVFLLYKGDFYKKKYSPAIFDFEFSLKFRIGTGELAPALRFTNYCFYPQNHRLAPAATRELRTTRLRTLKDVFEYFGMLSHKNNASLNKLSEITADKSYILPIQFAVDLQKDTITLKVYYWCDEKYGLSLEKRRAIISQIIPLFSPLGNADKFLKDKNIFFFSIDFKNGEIGTKIYLLYKGYRGLLKDLKKFHFWERSTKLLKKFMTRQRRYFDNEPVLCLTLHQGQLSVKKVEIFIKKELRNRRGYTQRITRKFLAHFAHPSATNFFPKEYPAQNIYVYSVGADFVTVYSRFKTWTTHA